MSIVYPSVIQGLSDPAYRREKAISQSLLRQYHQSPTPLHFFKRHWDSGKPFLAPSDAMQLGSVFHARMEHRDEGEFEKHYVKLPKGARKTGDSAKEFRAAHGNKALVSAPHWDLTLQMYKAVKRNKTALKILEDGVAEESFFFKNKGQSVKGRMDVRTPSGIVADWKTTMAGSPFGEGRDSFKKSIIMGRLDWQAAFYRKKANDFFPDKSHDFIFVAVEKAYPFACSLITLSETDMKRAEDQVFSCLDEVSDRLNRGDFGGGYEERVWKINLGKIV